jgi:Uncharacterized protein conserved in bacteria (DUF2242)
MYCPLFRLSLLAPFLIALAACGGKAATQPTYMQDMFSSVSSPYSHDFDASTHETCEASRRALLSQGYMATLPQPDTVDATKNFQPTPDSHVVMSFHVVCTPGENASNTSTVYVNAVQDGYALKKSDTSASVGLSVLGSLSLPIRSNNDSMVKISSETVPPGKFYDRFFSLVGHYLKTVPRSSPIPGDDVSSHALAPSLILDSPGLTPTPIVVTTPGAATAIRQPQVAVNGSGAVSVTAPGAALEPQGAAAPATAAPTPPAAASTPAQTPASASASTPSAASPPAAATAAKPVPAVAAVPIAASASGTAAPNAASLPVAAAAPAATSSPSAAAAPTNASAP